MAPRFNYGKKRAVRGTRGGPGWKKADYVSPRGVALGSSISVQQEASLREREKLGIGQPSLPRLKFMEDRDE